MFKFGMRRIEGRYYYLSVSFDIKGEAKTFADNFRSLGYGACVIKLKSKWGVYTTRTKIRRTRR